MSKKDILEKLIYSLKNDATDWEQVPDSIAYIRNIRTGWVISTYQGPLLLLPVGLKFGFFDRQKLTKAIEDWKVGRFNLLIELQKQGENFVQQVSKYKQKSDEITEKVAEAQVKKKPLPQDLIKPLQKNKK